MAADRGEVGSSSDNEPQDDDNAGTGRDLTPVDRDIGAFHDGMAVTLTDKVVIRTGKASSDNDTVNCSRDNGPSGDGNAGPAGTSLCSSSARPIGPMT